MGKTKKPPRFQGEFLETLLIVLFILGTVIYDLTKEPLIYILMFASAAILLPGILWFGIREYHLRFLFRFKLRKWWLLGFLLLFVSFSMIDWIWVKLCLVLLAGGLMLYDTIPRKYLRNVKRGE